MVTIKKSIIFDFMILFFSTANIQDMNMITADFNWISFLILIVAGIIGIVKSANAKKQGQKPVFQFPDFQEEENIEEIVEDIRLNDEYEPYSKIEEEIRMPEVTPGVYKEQAKEQNQTTPEKTEEISREEELHFNLRQAIISSEILRRPEF